MIVFNPRMHFAGLRNRLRYHIYIRSSDKSVNSSNKKCKPSSRGLDEIIDRLAMNDCE